MEKVEVKFGEWIEKGFNLYKENIATLILATIVAILLSAVTLGILAGPVGVVTSCALGAALGGMSAKLEDVGFDNTQLERLGASLHPGESAILAVLDRSYADLLSEKL